MAEMSAPTSSASITPSLEWNKGPLHYRLGPDYNFGPVHLHTHFTVETLPQLTLTLEKNVGHWKILKNR